MALLETATFGGLGMVAIWVYLRYPGLRPGSLVRAVAHVGVSFALFNLVPSGLDLCLALPAPASILLFELGVLIPTLGYVFVSWIWLIARLQDLGTPRGGHPVRQARAPA